MRQYVQAMCDSIAHRGPDGEGYWIDPSSRIALGHRRLAILDLSEAGNQPMKSRDGRWTLCFNGELYNHQSVRAELSRDGYVFRGHSDTETLIAAIERWGLTESLSRFAGMFAIALWDADERCLYLARDRMGEKPLYYGRVGDSFAFASEAKAFRCLPGWTGTLDEDAIDAFLERGYVPAPFSIFKGIHKLCPGTLLCVNGNHNAIEMKETSYWRLDDVIRNGLDSPITNPHEAVELLETNLKQIVGEQMEADVPLGAFLSGGLDSSCVVSLMQQQSARRIRTFTIGFDDPRLDESAQARAIADHLGTDHTELRVTAQDALTLLPALGGIYDEPFADQSQLPTVLLARLTRQHVTVSLSGDGGDELFAGYGHYRAALGIWWWLQRSPPICSRSAAKAISMFVSSLSTAARYCGCTPPRQLSRLRTVSRLLTSDGPEGIADALTNPNLNHSKANVRPRIGSTDERVPGLDPLSRLMAHDQRVWLPDDILVKLDRATMASSLESRAPFLDHRIVELAWRISPALKLNGDTSKWVLQKVLHRRVPSHLTSKRKQGFCIPLGTWLSGPLKSWAEDLLSSRRIRDLEVIQGTPRINKLPFDRRLWTVLMLASWLESTAPLCPRTKAA